MGAEVPEGVRVLLDEVAGRHGDRLVIERTDLTEVIAAGRVREVAGRGWTRVEVTGEDGTPWPSTELTGCLLLGPVRWRRRTVRSERAFRPWS